jgi:LacI family transcriptional regulator
VDKLGKTIRDIAKMANVSVTTVSRALNDYSDVSDKTKSRILKIARDIKYKPNVVARSLALGRSGIVGVLIPSIDISFWPSILEGLEKGFERHRYFMLLCTYEPGNEQSVARQLEALIDRKVDGIVFGAMDEYLGAKSLQAVVSVAHTPVVILTNELIAVDIPSVKVDNFHGGFIATEHLIELGHRRICCIGHEHRTVGGYCQALLKHDIAVDASLIIDAVGWDAGYDITSRLLDMDERPTAVFALDITCYGILKRLRELGKRAPYDLALVGFDDMKMSSLIETGLTSVCQPKQEQGSITADLILNMINEQKVVGCVLRPKLVVRESSLGELLSK